jgi:hypothetical protein
MTLRKFLTCYLGAVLFVGTAGASGYQVLSRQHAQLAAAQSVPPRVMAAAEPVASGNSTPEAAASPAVNAPSSAPASPAQRRAAAPPLRSRVATSGTGHGSQSYRLAERRPGTVVLTARPTRRTVVQTFTPIRPVPMVIAGHYVARSQPVWVYGQPVAPTVVYYPYRGYAYYYPRYQYYRVY